MFDSCLGAAHRSAVDSAMSASAGTSRHRAASSGWRTGRR